LGFKKPSVKAEVVKKRPGQFLHRFSVKYGNFNSLRKRSPLKAK
jgi:hypothetical protein